MSQEKTPIYLTANLPGIGGVYKQRAEDFVVEEQLTTDLANEGEYLYLFLESIGKTSAQTAQKLAQIFSVSEDKIDYVYSCDKQTVARQIFSIKLPSQDKQKEKEALDKLLDSKPDDKQQGDKKEQSELKLLWSDRHISKLTAEDIDANMFVIRIREVSPMDVIKAKKILDKLEQTGIPAWRNEADEAKKTPNIALRWPDVSGGVDELGAYIKLTFELARGAKVNAVLHELMKK